jgi:hypothetical protein
MAADVLISGLVAAAPLVRADLVELEQGSDPTNVSAKTTLGDIADFCAQTAFTVKTATGVIGAIDAESIVMNVGTANTLTIQADATINLPVGTIKNVLQEGTGQTTLVADTGVTILCAAATLKARARYSILTIVKRSANTWYAFGDFASS